MDKFPGNKSKNSIKLFEQFINEALGVAEPTIEISRLCMMAVKKYLDVFLNQKENLHKYEFIFVPGSSRQYKSWQFFPISRIELSIKLNWLDHEHFSERYPITSKLKNFNTFGACSDFINESDPNYFPNKDCSLIQKDGTIFLRLEVGMDLSNNFKESEVEESLLELESAIYHELNHAYEGYQLSTKLNKAIPTGITHALENKPDKIDRKIWKYWEDEFTMPFYWAEPHEIRAAIQESLPYKRKYSLGG